MKLTVLGSGTPAPSLARMSAGYMVEVGDDVLLLDHGPGAYHRLLEAGKAPLDVSHLFLTHLHYDHCLDTARLVLTRWDQSDGSARELEVAGPAGTAGFVEALVGESGAFAPDLRARTQHGPSLATYVLRGGTPPRPWPAPAVTELRSGAVYEGKDWRVSCVSVPHAQPHLECLGLRVDGPGGAIAYSGDAGPSSAFARLARGVDVIVHMCHQISGTAPDPEWERGAAGHLEVARIAAEAGARVLVASHIPSQMDVPGLRESLTVEMAALFDGSIVWAEDLLGVPLEPAKPAAHVG